MTDALALERGRELFARKAWAESYRLLQAADRDAPLEPEDLERLAIAAYLVGQDDDCEVIHRARASDASSIAATAKGPLERRSGSRLHSWDGAPWPPHPAGSPELNACSTRASSTAWYAGIC